ncbi:hypothetical protein dqs_2015 [Azoarcus olearius]|uniref:DUF3693 domain-containing protein n=1 Tax=Azoarcus sp. (strain BH72) TaxID=418699 RepID=UPI0008063F65|nr:DUF3693 domain-containing protein [Azoarcus olearius]ANQ85053.1 hypothetical protein dqs_2015 [Azoarcus olearius]
MIPIRRYLDEAIDKGIVKNDAELAAKLGVARSTVSRWRDGDRAPDEDQAAGLAALLDKPEILAACMATRAKVPEHRAMWERAAKTLSMAASFTAVIAANLLLAPSPAKAAPLLETQVQQFVLCKLQDHATELDQLLGQSSPRPHFSDQRP